VVSGNEGSALKEVITSTANAQVKAWSRLKMKKGRDESGLFIVEQPHMIQEAISAGTIQRLLIRQGSPNPYGLAATEVSAAVMDKLSENVSDNIQLAICRIPQREPAAMNRSIILQDVQDPGNVGTIIRCAVAFGYDAVFLDDGCADVYGFKAVSASQGALFRIPVIRQPIIQTFSQLRKFDVTLVATTPHQAQMLQSSPLPDRYALVFGNEGQGLTESAIAECDIRVAIEMEGFESLNVAAAAAVCAYYFRYAPRKQ